MLDRMRGNLVEGGFGVSWPSLDPGVGRCCVRYCCGVRMDRQSSPRTRDQWCWKLLYRTLGDFFEAQCREDSGYHGRGSILERRCTIYRTGTVYRTVRYSALQTDSIICATLGFFISYFPYTWIPGHEVVSHHRPRTELPSLGS